MGLKQEHKQLLADWDYLESIASPYASSDAICVESLIRNPGYKEVNYTIKKLICMWFNGVEPSSKETVGERITPFSAADRREVGCEARTGKLCYMAVTQGDRIERRRIKHW